MDGLLFWVPHLLTVYNDTFKRGQLPHSITKLLIIFLYTPGKSLKECVSYRPILFINSNRIILIKVLAHQIAKVVQY